MEIRIDRNKFLHSLSHVHQVAERKNTVEILRNVLLEAGDGRLNATATDIDTTLCETIECYVDAPGEKTVSAFMLYDIVRKMPDGAEISIVAEDNAALKVTAGRSLFRLAVLPKSDFPAVDEFDVTMRFQLPAADMRDLIEHTLFAAASTSEIRYYLNGIYLHHHTDGSLRAVATNSHRLAYYDVSLPKGAESLNDGVILPRKAVSELRRILDNHDDDITLEIGQANARFVVGNIVLTCKLIAGKYPDYQRVIPTLEGKPLILKAQELFDGITRVSTISNVSQNNNIKFQLADNKLVLEAIDQNSNLGQEVIGVDTHGQKQEIGFNAQYLSDIGSLVKEGDIRFWLPQNNSPVVITVPDKPTCMFVLMPTRV